MSEPLIIQGGMGVGVSGWPLANAVSRAGQLGMVSGTVLDVVFARRLQNGDPGGHVRAAISHFPVPEIAQNVYDRYFIEGGKAADEPFKQVPLHSTKINRELQELTVFANFVEVWLAKRGHQGIVGINFMEKLLMPNLTSIYGVMLAGVDYIVMGAGIPREIPGAIDRLVNHEAASLKLDVVGASRDDDYRMNFDPMSLLKKTMPKLKRPKFIAIVASTALATSLARKATGKIDGFVVEEPIAGGHNAPPRGDLQLDAAGEPIYGARDQVDFAKIKNLGVPFWLAGGYGRREKIQAALDLGATGVQVGTPFALSAESSLAAEIKREVLATTLNGQVKIFTDPIGSPTGFPFKVACLPGTISEEPVYEARPRRCDLGYLRQFYKKSDGTVGYRCSAEPVDAYVSKGGDEADTRGRICLCNGLISNIGLAQIQKNGYVERPVVTLGDDVATVKPFISAGALEFTAAEVIEYLTET